MAIIYTIAKSRPACVCPCAQGTQNRDFMDNWTVHVTISSLGESQGTPGTALGLASWM